MVAEFVGRGQSGSPVNGEVPQLNSGLPNSREMLSRSNSPNPDHYQMQSSSSSSTASMNNNNNNKHHKELFSQRKQREFTPDNKKDDNYWDRRRRNNEAAKRSREKRRFNDMVLEQRVVELTKENAILKAQLEAIREEYGVCVDNVVCVEKVLANLPTSEQVLSLTKRQKLVHPGAPSSTGGSSSLYGPQSPQIIPSTPSSVIHQTLNNQQQQQQQQQQLQMSHQHQQQNAPSSASSLQHQQQQVQLEPAYREHHHHHLQSEYHHYHHQIPPYRHPSPGALNLSARRPKSSPSSPFELSSTSGDDEGCGGGGPPTSSTTSILIQPSVPQLLTSSSSSSEPNNSLPLKLRHKSHLGDKDAASALLALHNIKQEPSRASPPWDGEGSSDERDSGISLGAEWTATQAAATLQSLQKSTNINNNNNLQETTKSSTQQQQHHPYHSEIVRLTTEVEQLKSLMKEKDAHRRH